MRRFGIDYTCNLRDSCPFGIDNPCRFGIDAMGAAFLRAAEDEDEDDEPDKPEDKWVQCDRCKKWRKSAAS